MLSNISILRSLVFAVAVLVPLAASADWRTSPEIFIPAYYANHNPDVRDQFRYDAKQLEQHWLRSGMEEGRPSSPVFHAKYYLQANPDVAAKVGADNYVKATIHWYESGITEGRPSHPKFRVRAYLKENPDVARAVGEGNYRAAIHHYIKHGYEKGRKAN